jgi:2-iminobutanoate/2-iminopropanoate deaminase
MGDKMRDVIPAPVPGLDLRREYGHHQSPAIRAGGLIFCSGMVAINPENGEREHGTVTSETRRIFENLKLLLDMVRPRVRIHFPPAKSLQTIGSAVGRSVGIISDSENGRATLQAYGRPPYPVLVIAFRSVATVTCGQLIISPLKFNNTVWVYCSCRTSGPPSSSTGDSTSASCVVGALLVDQAAGMPTLLEAGW